MGWKCLRCLAVQKFDKKARQQNLEKKYEGLEEGVKKNGNEKKIHPRDSSYSYLHYGW